MNPLKLFAELQVNPFSVTVYRKLADHYRNAGMTNEAEAFEDLIRKKFDAHSPHVDKEQQPNNQGST
jgi:hypothetical protein